MLGRRSNHHAPLILLLGVLLGFNSNSNAQIDHWEIVVYETDTWSYLVPDAPVDSDWNTLSFDADS